MKPTSKYVGKFRPTTCITAACFRVVMLPYLLYGLQIGQAEACHTDTTPTSHTETPTHIETKTHNQCGDTIEKSQVPDDGCTNVRTMLSTEEVK